MAEWNQEAVKCSQKTCEDQAQWTYFWPGNAGGAPSYACWPHRNATERIAKTMGFTVVFRPMKPVPLEAIYRVSGLEGMLEAAIAEDIGLGTVMDVLRLIGATPPDIAIVWQRLLTQRGP